jgi:hypothetical protein
MVNAEFAACDALFLKCCDKARELLQEQEGSSRKNRKKRNNRGNHSAPLASSKLGGTRQASKFRRGVGLAFKMKKMM